MGAVASFQAYTGEAAQKMSLSEIEKTKADMHQKADAGDEVLF